jgi:hypothetical protein
MSRLDGSSAGVVNLKRARKAALRARKQASAEENRARFGRTRAQVLVQTKALEIAERRLDGAKRDPEE